MSEIKSVVETSVKGIDSVPRYAHLAALAGYFVLALVVSYPAALHFTGSVPGDLIADRNQNLWNLWWVGHALGRFTNPFHTDMLYYPYGVSLYYHTLGLPQGLLALLPQALFGLPAAYNSVLLAAFTLGGYGAFRLGLIFTQRAFPAFLGGIVFAFTPYTLDALKGQLEVLSVQWMPFYVEAWLRTCRPDVGLRASPAARYGPSLLAGLFFALAAYSSLYYAAYLLVFTGAYLVYMLVRKREPVTGDNSKFSIRNPIRNPKLLITAIVALALLSPLLVGLAANRSNPRLEVKADPAHRLAHSADLLSFVAPPHDHPLVGTPAKPGVDEPAMHDYLSLGFIALALSLLGVWAWWKDRSVRFWTLLGLFALLLAMGPQLQIGRNVTPIPLPFKLIEWLPGADAIAKPERFVVLARLCMGVLAACGAAWLQSKSFRGRTLSLAFSIILPLLLLAELPLHPRYIEPLPDNSAWSKLDYEHPLSGALMELPFATQQVETVSYRMLAQTTHGLPIMSGYLSRNYNSPIVDSCSPFWGFISPRDVPAEGHEIASPLVVSRLSDVLNFYNIRYIALDARYAGPTSPPLDPKERAAYMNIIGRVAYPAPLFGGDMLSTYNVIERDVTRSEASFHVGGGWYNPEVVGGSPFRWLKGGDGVLCVFAPRPINATLTLEGTAFGAPREVTLSVGGKSLYSGTLAAGGLFSRISTGVVAWQPGVTEVHLLAKGEPVTPESLDPATRDNRPLSVGFKAARLETNP